MAEIGDYKNISPLLPTRPAKPVIKSGDQQRQPGQQQSGKKNSHQHDREEDDGLPHIDEYA